MSGKTMTGAMRMSRFAALLGSLLTLVQIVLLASEREAICLNDGCTVVDSLTTVDPLFFNIGGFVFFQTIFWGTWLAGSDNGRRRLLNIILLAALAAEGVLVGFQHYVAEVFCSYCLIILAFVIILNILAGTRQIITGTAIFCAVLIAFASLRFDTTAGESLADLDRGAYALLEAEGEGEEDIRHHFFFSSTCRYCEEVLESLIGEVVQCDIRFNPIDTIGEFPLERAVRQSEYSPTVNRAVLEHFGLQQIPVLLVSAPESLQVLKGAGAIREYLQQHCLEPPEPAAPAADALDLSGSSRIGDDFDFAPPADEACRVEADCEEPLPQDRQ